MEYILEIPRLPSSKLSPNKLGGNRHAIGKARRIDKLEAYLSWREEHPKVQRPFEKSHLHIAFVVGWLTGPGFDQDNALARSKSFIDGIKEAGAIEDDSTKYLSLSFEVIVDKQLEKQNPEQRRPEKTIMTLREASSGR
jgi:hypothetical protein